MHHWLFTCTPWSETLQTTVFQKHCATCRKILPTCHCPKGLVQHGVVWVNHQWIHCSVGENASVGIENPSQKSLFWNKCFYKWGNIVSLRHTVMLSRFSSGCLMAEGIKVCWIFHICCGLKKRTLVPWVRCRWQLQTQHLLVGQVCIRSSWILRWSLVTWIVGCTAHYHYLCIHAFQ